MERGTKLYRVRQSFVVEELEYKHKMNGQHYLYSVTFSKIVNMNSTTLYKLSFSRKIIVELAIEQLKRKLEELENENRS